MQQCHLLLIVLMLQTSRALELKEEWELWKSRHGKSYASDLVELEKQRIWIRNRDFILQHNANANANANTSTSDYTLALNQFADLVRYPNVIHKS